MGSQRCNSFFRNKGKRKGLLSQLLTVYEMFCLCETYRESGSVLNLLIFHICFGKDPLPHTFASRDSSHVHHCSLFFRFIYSINRHTERLLSVAGRQNRLGGRGCGLQGSHRMVGTPERRDRIRDLE